MEQDKRNMLAHKLTEIERMRKDLIKLVEDKGGNFQDREVIRLSELLDESIVEYLKILNRYKVEECSENIV
jgi:hypothetical protein